jgi:tetratricopeptide (TPR) repeat protein/transglutaminase-like putative cysteine protease
MFRRGALLASSMLGLALVPRPSLSWSVRSGGAPEVAQKSDASGASEKVNKHSDSSQEPYVIEHYDTVARFEHDGTGERDVRVRVRVQSEEGAQRFREIVFAYDSMNEKIDIRSVSITKPGGSAVKALAPDAVQEVPSAITRDAPAYGAYKEVHIRVPSLQAGDVLDYQVAIRVVTPFAPGEFWFAYSFAKDAIVLDERVDVSLPEGQPFHIKSPGFYEIAGKESRPAPSGSLDRDDFVVTKAEENGRTILRWKRSNLTAVREDEQPTMKTQRPKSPDIQLTSFPSWNAVARWYAEFEKKRSAPSPEITAKAQELVRGATNELEKMRALYAYVSKNIRYVNTSLDLGVLQPRSPANVLADGYGDSPDKQALLAAMLEAAGIPSEAALIPSAGNLDRDLPSPSQFDRVITAVPQNGKLLWMDAAPEVAPFRFLPASLRNKSVLLVSREGSGKIIETPADPPFPSTQDVELACQLSELGKLSGTIRYSLRGDTEFLLRTAFERTPKAEWNQLAQTILTLDGLRGEVVRVEASDPRDTEKPFQLSVEFFETNLLTWPDKRGKIALPLLTIATPDPPTQSTQPVKLGSPLDVTTRLRLSFPPSFRVEPPVGVTVPRDYAEFKSSYRFLNSTLFAERSLNFKMRELPASRTPDYLAFTHAVEADESQSLLVENPSARAAAIPATATADDIFEAGQAALQSGNTRAAIPLLERTTAIEPAHRQAWSALGLAYLRVGKFDQAIGAFRKQLEVNPADEKANDYLGLALQQQQRTDEAAAAFRKQIELNPLDSLAHTALGTILLAQRKYSDAVLELEKAVILSPEKAALEVSLGRAYLGVGDQARALASLEKGVELSPTPAVWNDVAFSLAERGIELDKAQHYAESAITATAADLQKLALAHATAGDFARVGDMGDYWDTLGWVYFQKGDLPKAGRYVQAAWTLAQRGEVGDHLAQIYEKAGEKDRAIHTYALALAARNSIPETRARLTLLLGGNAQIDDLVSRAPGELQSMRTFEVKQTSKEDVSAEFLVLLSPSGREGLSTRIEEVRFLGGSEALRSSGDSLKTLGWGRIFPDDSPVKLVRRGTLTCSAASAGCKFTLALPEIVPGRN